MYLHTKSHAHSFPFTHVKYISSLPSFIIHSGSPCLPPICHTMFSVFYTYPATLLPPFNPYYLKTSFEAVSCLPLIYPHLICTSFKNTDTNLPSLLPASLSLILFSLFFSLILPLISPQEECHPHIDTKQCCDASFM